MMASVILGMAGRLLAVAGRAGAGGSLAWAAAWIVLFGRAPSLTSAFASGRLLPSCLASGARGPGCAAGVSTDGGRGQRRARSAWRFWAVCRLRGPSAAAIRVQGAPPSGAAAGRASPLPSSSPAMRRAAASAVSAAVSSRPPARAAAVSPASVSATLASPSPPCTGILPGRVSTVRGRVSVAGVLLFGRRDEQLAGVFRVADRPGSRRSWRPSGPPSGGGKRSPVAPSRGHLRRSCRRGRNRSLAILLLAAADLVRLGDQQLLDAAAQDGADHVEVGQLDAGRVAGPQPGHLPGADDQVAVGEHPLQLAGLPDGAVGGCQPQVPLHFLSPFSRSAARCWPAIHASSTWVPGTWT